MGGGAQRVRNTGTRFVFIVRSIKFGIDTQLRTWYSVAIEHSGLLIWYWIEDGTRP